MNECVSVVVHFIKYFLVFLKENAPSSRRKIFLGMRTCGCVDNQQILEDCYLCYQG